jgi:hypothetical protein
MNQANTPNSKVIIEPSASGALLALAYREGLLVESNDNDDCLKTLASRNYPDWLTTQALEQVVLFDQLHLTSQIPWRGIHGELIEAGPFVSVDEPSKPEGEVQEIDPAIVNGILKARGISPTLFEDPSILEGVDTAFRRLNEWEKKYGEEPPSPIAVVVKRIFAKESNLDPKYVELEEIRRPLQAFQPIASAIQEYLEVVATAQERAAFVMTPTYESGSQQLFQPRITALESNAPTVLLRLTSAKLGVLPFGQSLKETLQLARDPATIALRVKIQEWTDSLTEDSGEDTERIQKEISHSLSILKKAKIGAHASNITTYLGIPLALLSPVFAFVAAMGWICTIAGTVGLVTSHATTKKYEWASFGSSNNG